MPAKKSLYTMGEEKLFQSTEIITMIHCANSLPRALAKCPERYFAVYLID